MAEHMVQTTYNAQHQAPWHWPVPAYLVTKGIGSGIFGLLAIFFGLNIVDFNPLLALAGSGPGWPVPSVVVKAPTPASS